MRSRKQKKKELSEEQLEIIKTSIEETKVDVP